MHGLGNDFMVVDGINQTITLSPEDIQSWSKRNTGIGFDQLLLVEASNAPGIDFNYRIFNANGQEVGQCGNGARCLALFLRRYKLTDKNNIIVSTSTTKMNLLINDDNTVTVNMGKPKLIPQDIPLKADTQQQLYDIPLKEGKSVGVHAINVGNPHALIIVNDIEDADVEILGSEISKHPVFPHEVNVGLMQIISSNHTKLRVYERGCGETEACGSGAVAAAALGRLYHQLDDKIKVDLPGGSLVITWSQEQDDIFLTGPASFVYEGHLLNA